MSRERLGSLVVAALAASFVFAASAHAAFPGQDGKIAFDEFQTTDEEIVTVEPDGTGRATLTANAVRDFEPAWSADGKLIVFARNDPNTQVGEIWVMNADGTGQVQLTDDVNNGANDSAPAFNGDGTRIVFSRGVASTREIWVMNANGTGQTSLTSGQFDDQPTFSPDGTRIAFNREYDAGMTFADAIMGMTAGGMGVAPLTPMPTVDAAGPNFSPDGTRLTFGRCDIVGEGCPTPFEVATMPSGGGTITEVTSNAGNFTDPSDIDPVFAPDGTLIAFNRQEFFTSASDLFTVGSGGGAIGTVTTSGEARNPDWQPLPAKKLGKCDGQRATIQGTDDDDKIVGTPGHDVIKGLKGDDKIKGKGGNDLLCGQRGDDRIFGGRGDDVLIGGKGNDFLKGGPGHDRMFGGTRNAPNDRTKEDFCVGSEQDKSNNCKDDGA